MLDSFEILTTSGVVLWSRTFAAPMSPAVNSFIKDVFIEEKTSVAAAAKDGASAASNPPYKYDQHTLRWAFVKELGIIFVAVYRSLLHLSWIDKLVDNIKAIFVSLYGDQLKKPNTTILECPGFDAYFDQQYAELEKLGSKSDAKELQAPEAGEEPPLPAFATPKSRVQVSSGKDDQLPEEGTPNTSRPSTPGSSHLVVAKAGPVAKMSRRARKAQANTSAPFSSGDEGPTRRAKPAAKAAKRGRKWDADGFADEDDSDVQLDYSATNAAASESEAGPGARRAAVEEVDASTWGSQSKGKFVLKDLGDEVHQILASEEAKKAAAKTGSSTSSGLVGSGLSAIGGLFRNVVGGKVLTKEDMDKAMKGMEEHLLKKNVAREAAIRLCEGVEKELVGVKTANFESINTRIQKAMEASLTKMLTPTSSLDLLREIDSITAPPATSLRKARPYVISIVGVNGVGKSTNLSKICFFLLQNKYKILIAAGDTFRSGAVEQLAVHVRNLKELTAREGGKIELYQKGYGKDAAVVAKEAVTFAAQEGFDVVLIDTAGRRHNDQRLMSSLEKFAKFAQPDKILMVGEALVGTDSVAQARNFNAAFGSGRSLDGFIISKCDTVGDMVGTLVSLVHATNVPVLFVGVGQHYSDLRNFSVKWAVEKLLSSN
ncbi:putative signal recognition particle receptor subunit alpha [Naviculisporaceae sp. PSN 640]